MIMGFVAVIIVAGLVFFQPRIAAYFYSDCWQDVNLNVLDITNPSPLTRFPHYVVINSGICTEKLIFFNANTENILKDIQKKYAAEDYRLYDLSCPIPVDSEGKQIYSAYVISLPRSGSGWAIKEVWNKIKERWTDEEGCRAVDKPFIFRCSGGDTIECKSGELVIEPGDESKLYCFCIDDTGTNYELTVKEVKEEDDCESFCGL